MKINKALPIIPALFPGADYIIRAIPVPAQYALLIKVPTALICLVLVVYAQPSLSKRSAIRFASLGIVCLVIYLILSSALLYSDPQKYRPGDNSIVGLWLTDGAVQEMTEKGWNREALHSEYGPVEWVLIYNTWAQLSSAVILSIIYCSSFALLTYGLSRIPGHN